MQQSRLLRATLFLVLVLSVLAGPASTQAAAPATSSGLSAVLVRFADSLSESTTPSPTQQSELQAAGARGAITWLGEPGLFRVGVDNVANVSDVIAALQNEPDVRYAEPDQTIHLTSPDAQYQAATDAVSSAAQTWALDAIDAKPAWQLGTGKDVIVAVLDTGVSATHPDLAGRVLPGWNFVQNNGNTADDSGHGTFVAGLIAGDSGTDHEGVAPGVSILPVKILNQNEVGSTASFVAGINYAVASGARVINISASGAGDSAALNDALANAEAHGAVVVASAGNDAREENVYPAAVPTVLAVSATDRQNALASFASYGPFVDVAAPGVDIWSSWWSAAGGDGHITASGSSASTPLVSGVAAIIAGLRPGASPASIREIITESTLDVGSPGVDAQTGFGLVDAYAAARIASPPSNASASSITLAQTGDGAHLQFLGNGFSPGEQVLLWTSTSDGYVVHRSIQSDQSGSVDVDLGQAWRFPEGEMGAFAVGAQSAHVDGARYDVVTQPASGPFQPITPVESTADRIYFAETGHSLSYGFKQFWESNGGLAVFGYPISEEFSEKNADTGQVYTVQYFERYRFEYHPEYKGTPAEVSLGRLGAQIAPQVFPTGIQPSDSNQLYFAATQHTLSGPFRAFWESHGGLAIFGYPTSEPFEQGGVLVQYFERARFELHPDLPADNQVLLSRLGISLARADGYLR